MARTVHELQHQAKADQDKKVLIFNPLTDDFTVHYDSKPCTARAQEITAFDYVIGQHVRKHLAQQLAQDKDSKKAYDIRYKEALEEIDVTI